MNRNLSRALKGVVLAAAVAAPLAANAESNFVTGGGALNAQARVDFQITIPKVLFLQVGTGALSAIDGTVDLINFVVPATNVGDGNSVAATAGSGDLGNGTVTAIVRGNGGDVTFDATTLAGLTSGLNSINWGEISTASAPLAGYATLLSAPVLPNVGTTSVNLPAIGGVVNQGAQWTYGYDNSGVVPAGVYNGRVTYTASLP